MTTKPREPLCKVTGVSLTPSLMDTVDAMAANTDRSRSAMIRWLLKQAIQAEQKRQTQEARPS